VQHVVGPAEDAAVELPPAVSESRGGEFHDVTGAIANQWAGGAPEIGQHKFAEFARGRFVLTRRFQHLDDVFAFE